MSTPHQVALTRRGGDRAQMAQGRQDAANVPEQRVLVDQTVVVVVKAVEDRGQLVTLAAGTDEQTESANQLIDAHGGLLLVDVGTL